MKIFTLCRPYLLSQKSTLITYIVIILATASITIISPYLIGNFLDNLIEGADINTILRFCAIYGSLNLIKIFKGYVTSIMYVNMQAKMGYDLAMDTIKHVQGLSLSYINNKDSTYLNHRISNDSTSLIVFCIGLLQNFITNAATFVIPFILLMTINRLVAILMLGFIVLYITLYLFFRKPIYNAGLAFREAQAKLFAGLSDQLKYIKLIKVNSTYKEMNSRADNSFLGLKRVAIHNQKVNYLYSGMDGFISTLAQTVLLVVGGIQILLGNFTIGMFTIFSSYFNMMLISGRYFFGLGAAFQNALVSCDRIRGIFEQNLESHGSIILRDVNKIQLSNVNFSYCDKDRITIENISAKFHKGKVYAVSGANGAGKSTLLSLIMGLYIDEYKGSITYNDVDIRNIDMIDARRRLIGFAEQEPMLVNDSIRFNLGSSESESIDSGEDDTLKQSLDAHIETLNMQDFISKNSFDFPLNENSTNTSGGEKQKIAILKVLYKNPIVMIFDEPTSALDAHTTRQFIDYLQQIKRDKIIIMITHDEFVKEICDDVVNL